MHLTALTGLRAASIEELLTFIKTLAGSCIYHHTHRFLQQHQYLAPEPPNDFAYWITAILGEKKLGERLAAIDTIQYPTIRALRERLISVIEDYLVEHPLVRLKFCRPEEEFRFMKSVSFILPTKYAVYTIEEFAESLKNVSLDSIYFHIFEARLRLGRPTNDFSYWIEASLGNQELAEEISRLKPYMHTLEELRNIILAMIKTRQADKWQK